MDACDLLRSVVRIVGITGAAAKELKPSHHDMGISELKNIGFPCESSLVKASSQQPTYVEMLG